MAVTIERYIKIRKSEGATDEQIKREIFEQFKETMLNVKVDKKNMEIILGNGAEVARPVSYRNRKASRRLFY